MTQVAKVLQHAANISPRGYEADSVQSETAELLNRLSARPERFDSLPSNTGMVKSLADLKRNPNRPGLILYLNKTVVRCPGDF